MASNHTITFELDDERYQLLKTLCGPPHGNETVDEVVRDIAVGFADGVRRPGSWERGCVVQFFSREFEGKLEVADPSLFMRPKPTEPAPPAVHGLRAGRPICGFTTLVPQFWPEGQSWSGYKDEVTCQACVAAWGTVQGTR